MDEDEIKRAEKRGYARGYAAGKQRRQRDQSAEQRYREDRAFLDRAFMAALPACVNAQGWKTGDTPITDVPGRVNLAWDFAIQALKTRRYP
jgi:hypothetical protein